MTENNISCPSVVVLKVNVCHVHQTQLSPVSKGAYREYLGKLDLQYGKLLVRGAIFVF